MWERVLPHCIDADWIIWVRGSDVARPEPPMYPKETSLTTHPDASIKMYGINKKGTQLWERVLPHCIDADWVIWVRGSDVARPEPPPHEPKGNITDDPSRCINKDVWYK